MKNVKATVNRQILTIEVDLTRTFGLSKSGKTVIIASTEGNIKVEREDGKEVFVGLNVYQYPEH